MRSSTIFVIGILLVLGAFFSASFAAKEEKKEAPQYVGDSGKTCKMCHAKEAKAWAEWPMSHAWDTLSAEEQKKEECISCHVTGYGKENGFISAKDTPGLLGIQCEACHGAAGNHPKNPMKENPAGPKPTAETCKACHNEKSPEFDKETWDVKKAMEEIKHWKDKEHPTAEHPGAEHPSG